MPLPTNHPVIKELHKLFVDTNKLFDGQVEFDCVFDNPGNIIPVDFFVTPNDGLYKNARISFQMTINIHRYPEQAPTIECHNEIYHPNIQYGSNSNGICVNILDTDWTPEVGLDGTINAVLFLFHHPDLDDILSSAFIGVKHCEFEHNVFHSLRGEVVDTIVFDELIKNDGIAKCPCDKCKNKSDRDTKKDVLKPSSYSKDVQEKKENESDNKLDEGIEDEVTAKFQSDDNKNESYRDIKEEVLKPRGCSNSNSNGMEENEENKSENFLDNLLNNESEACGNGNVTRVVSEQRRAITISTSSPLKTNDSVEMSASSNSNH